MLATNQERTLASSFWRTQTPDPLLDLSDWSDRFRVLSSISSSEPGPWRTDRTPYLREIMNCLSASSPEKEVIFMKGSQLGGTEIGLNWIGYVMDQAPGPMMVVQPTDLLAKRFSKQRLDYMLQNTERLRARVREKKSRDSSNTAIMKEFDGGILALSGANSAVQLRSMPIRFLMLDEVDGYPQDVGGEGDPVKLAKARTRTFTRKKIFQVSSPTIAGRSRIESAYDESDQRRYLVPCPHCQFYQPIVWARIRWEKNRPATAHMVCEKCDARIEEYHKTKMLELGRWVKRRPDRSVAGFHLSSLYSPLGWYSWSQAAEDFLQAKDNQLYLRVFTNTVLGETFKEKGEAPDWERLYERREPYPFNKVPKGALFLTAGIDVQRNRFEIEITAWGRDKQSWSIDYRNEEVDTSDERNYGVLDRILAETFPVEDSKVRLPIRLAAIDSGFNTQAVYQYARARAGRVIAVKGGTEKQHSIIGLPNAVDVSYGGKKILRGARVWMVGTNIAKSELYGWLQLRRPTAPGEPYPPGYCHFPEYPEEYFKMLTAEQLTFKVKRGFRKYEWVKYRDRNEALDARIYARAAAAVVGLDRYSAEDWNAMEEALRSKPDRPLPAEPVKTKGGIPIKDDSEYW